MRSLEHFTTEQRNPKTEHIDRVSTQEIVRMLHDEDSLVIKAVEKILPEVAAAIDTISSHLKDGGRLFYVGAGTSGRLGILDAAECPPTFGVSPQLVQGIIAGGPEAVFRAKEGVEDSLAQGESDLREKSLCRRDAVVGLAASGRTPYVIGALQYASSVGAATIAIACNENAPMNRLAEIAILPVVGPEAIAGSTRLKAGTAQKLVLNMLSTGTMISLGKVYKNLMIDVKATNIKLKERAERIVMEATSVSREQSRHLLSQTSYDVKTAILMAICHCSASEAAMRLEASKGHVANAIRREMEHPQI